MNDDPITSKLDELIAVMKSASLPFKDRWLDASGVGALLGYSGRHVAERIACKPDFPRPVRLDGGHPRWKAAEVLAWAETKRDSSQGRPRAA